MYDGTELTVGIEMPDEIRRWATMRPDTGLVLCINCIPECLREEAQKAEHMYIVPVPLRYVLEKGYSVNSSGYIYVDAEYNRISGLNIPEEYYE